MNLNIIDAVVVASYFGLLTAFGLIVRRIRGFEDFAVARRGLPTVMVFASLCSTYIGPGYSLGFAATAYNAGFALVPIWMFFSVQTIVVGLWLTPRLRQFTGAHTIGGVIGYGYGRAAERIAGLVSVGLCVGFAAVLGRAGGLILSQTTGLPLVWAIVVIAAVGVLYAWTGGLKSVVATEGLQFAIIIFSAGALLLFAGSHVSAFTDLDAAVARLSRESWESTSFGTMLGMVLLFACGEMLIPPYANRALSAVSTSASQRGFVFAGVFAVLWFLMMAMLGVIARTVLAPTGNVEGILVELARTVLPPGLLGLFFVALAAIVMSTIESLLNAAAVCFTRDLVPRRWDVGETRRLTIARVCTLGFAALATWLGLYSPSITEGLLICYSIWAPTILPALVWQLAGRRTHAWSGLAAIVGGGIASSCVLVFSAFGGGPAAAIVWGFLGSGASALVAYFASRLLRNDYVEGTL